MKIIDQYTESNQGKNISDYLRENAEIHPDKPALLHPERITYKELDKAVDNYSYGLVKAGISSGTRTVLMVTVGAEFFIITFALLRIGAVPVMIDPGMGVKALLNALSGLNAEAFIGITKAHLLRFIRPSVFKSFKVILYPGCLGIPGGKRIKAYLPGNNGTFPTCIVSNQNIAAIFFTSGSTGPAKGVVYTSGMINNQIHVTKSQFNIGTNEIDLCTFPLLGLFAICHGNSSVIADMDMVYPAKLDPSKIIKNIQDFGCTQMFGSPMILNKLSKYGTKNKVKLPSLRRIISAGAPVHRSILESFSQLIDNEAIIHTPYGATEALPVTDINTTELLSHTIREIENINGICIGYPVNGLEVKIIEITDIQIVSLNDTRFSPVNEVGEIIVKGPWVSTDYFNNPEANKLAKVYDPDEKSIWHRMGDLGRIDGQGRLWFYGRKSQRVITNNEVMFTIPCEAIFNQHPLISRSALVGINDKKTGLKKPVICIQLESGYKFTSPLLKELSELGSTSNLTKDIKDILFFAKFPVDPRHNAKIFREKLARWAENRIK